jgi:hypothetical protein
MTYLPRKITNQVVKGHIRGETRDKKEITASLEEEFR